MGELNSLTTFFSNRFLEVKKRVSSSYYLFKERTGDAVVQIDLQAFVWKEGPFPGVLPLGNSYR